MCYVCVSVCVCVGARGNGTWPRSPIVANAKKASSLVPPREGAVMNLFTCTAFSESVGGRDPSGVMM